MTNQNTENKRISGKRLLIIFAAVILMFCLASCGQSKDTSDTEKRPVITIGSEDYPPFMALDNNGQPTGLDIDIMKEALDRIGYDVNIVSINWEKRDDLLASGEIDCVVGGFTIKGREDDYLWVGPYMRSNQVVAINSTSDIHSLQDLKGKTIAVQTTSIAEDILLEHSNPDVPEDVQVFSYADNNLLFTALGCDYIDALISDEPVVAQYMKDYSTVFTILDEPVMISYVGAAFYKNGNAKLCAKLNTAIDEMREDGTLKKIIERYLDDADRYLGGETNEE